MTGKEAKRVKIGEWIRFGGSDYMVQEIRNRGDHAIFTVRIMGTTMTRLVDSRLAERKRR